MCNSPGEGTWAAGDWLADDWGGWVVGDWVVVSAGTVLRVLDPEEAEEIRTMLDEAARAEAALRGVTPPNRG